MKNRRQLNILFISVFFLAITLVVTTIYALIREQTKGIEFNMKSSTINVEYGDTFLEPGVKAKIPGVFLFSDDIKLSVTKEGAVDTNAIGKYKLKYNASYKDKSSSITLTINVRDTTPPEITLVSNPDSFTSPVGEYQEEGYCAVDNLDGDVTASVIATPGDGVINYSVKDSSGNEAKVTRKIFYKDVVPPTITLTGNSTVVLPLGDEFTDDGYTAVDDVDGDITEKVSKTGEIDNQTTGTYTITYEVSDNSGNATSIARNVIVYPKQTGDVASDNKIIYLTFDDGPFKYTQKLLDVLDKYNVKVTFFVTSQYPDYQYLMAEEAKRGHTVAIHSFSHNYGAIYTSVDAYMNDLNSMSNIIQNETGIKPMLVRFPGGSSNTVSAKYCSGIMTTLDATLTANGYQYFDWNVSSGDAGGTISTEQVIANVTSGIAGNSKSSVVLQHDIKEFSVDAVEQIILWGLSNGYTFLPLTLDSPTAHQHINN